MLDNAPAAPIRLDAHVPRTDRAQCRRVHGLDGERFAWSGIRGLRCAMPDWARHSHASQRAAHPYHVRRHHGRTAAAKRPALAFLSLRTTRGPAAVRRAQRGPRGRPRRALADKTFPERARRRTVCAVVGVVGVVGRPLAGVSDLDAFLEADALRLHLLAVHLTERVRVARARERRCVRAQQRRRTSKVAARPC